MSRLTHSPAQPRLGPGRLPAYKSSQASLTHSKVTRIPLEQLTHGTQVLWVFFLPEG